MTQNPDRATTQTPDRTLQTPDRTVTPPDRTQASGARPGRSLARPGRALWALLLAALLLLGRAPARAQSDASIQMLLGNPSGATASTANPNNYLIQRPQYALAYSRDNAIPRWVAWHLGSADLGGASRTTTFSSDTTLPSGWYRATSGAYTNTGWDRGHNCPSADRTATAADNKQLFLMSNIMPQAPDNNQGPWEQLEDYCRTLVTDQGDECYIYSCNDGTQGTLNSAGMITIPKYVNKVIVVIPEQGGNDLARITANTRVIAVSLPNANGIRSVAWQTYRCSVSAIEGYTGLTFFTALPASVASALRSKVDNQ